MDLAELFGKLNITWGSLGIIVLILLSLIEITPIKFNPWSKLGKWLGGLLNSEPLKKITELDGKIDDLDHKLDKVNDDVTELDSKIKTLGVKIEETESREEERGIIEARIRILRFCDELQEGHKHSKDSFDQALSDITLYETYCNNHPDFKNNQTASTIKYITKMYDERLEKHDFLNM